MPLNRIEMYPHWRGSYLLVSAGNTTPQYMETGSVPDFYSNRLVTPSRELPSSDSDRFSTLCRTSGSTTFNPESARGFRALYMTRG